jgi:putative ABC transport system permease protein
VNPAPRRRSFAERIFRMVLRLFPFDFRSDHGRDMEQTLRMQHREARQEATIGALARLWLDVARDVFTTAPRAHMAILRQDIGYALRGLRRAPVFALSAVLTLALGLSAMAGMFAIADTVMFRPLPVHRPEQLISISHRTGAPGLSFPDLQDYRARTPALADAIGYAMRPASLTVDGASERISVLLVTDNYFSMLGVGPATGRLIAPNEGRARGDAPVAVLAYEYWQSRFGANPAVIGRTVRMNGRSFTVIGVVPRGFRTESLVRVAAYVPAWMIEDFSDYFATAAPVFDDRSARRFRVFGRLRADVSIDEARAALAVTTASLAREYPSTHKDVELLVVPETHARPSVESGAFLRIATTVLIGLAAIVVLITSANVTNLLMARAASREREIALRTALGARRGRLVRQFLTEAVVLALLGAIAAVPTVAFAMRALRNLLARASAMASLDPDLVVDVRVLAASLAIAVAAGIVAGIAPALSACRADLGDRLRSGARAGSDGAGSRFRGALVVAQVALSLTLLVSGGLFVRSLEHARDVDLGFDPDGVFLATAAPGIQGYGTVQRLAFYRSVRDRIAAQPGVEAAAWISLPPMGIIGDLDEVSPDVQPTDPNWRPPVAMRADVTPEYFAAARVRLVDGRLFESHDDAAGTPVVIVNETLARQFWPGRSPIGRSLKADGDTLEVVGVARNGKYMNIGEAPRPAIYRPFAQTVPSSATLAIRTDGAPADIAAAMRKVMQDIDPDVAVYDVRSMATHLDNGSAFLPFRLGAFMTSLFGGMGILLVSIGLYGMIAYHVGQRTQEIGVRMALGARRADIIRDVLSHGSRFALIGIGIGMVLAAGLAHMLKGLLVGVSPFDPVTYAAVAGLLVTMCLLASYVPARRATSVDPLVALRVD